MENEFRKYASKHLGLNTTGLDRFSKATTAYISPTIIEERQLNIATMDVFSRLMIIVSFFWECPSTIMWPTSFRHNCSS